MKVYLAGPDVFLPDARTIGAAKKDICARFGLVGLYPLDGEDDAPDPGAATLSMQIFGSCIARMEDADAVIAHLTPFRGPSADPGTVFELGFMAARGRLCTGYTNRRGAYCGRVDHTDRTDGIVRDHDRLLVEDFGLADGLMIVHALDTFGLALLTPEVEPDDVFRDLTLFTKCVEWLAARRP